MANVRRAIVNALIKQEKGGYSNLILNSALENFEGTSEERAFFSAVFYGTVERMFTLDYILQKFMSKPLSKADAQVRCIMRSALYQAKFMDSVPSFAAINEAVTLTKKMGKSSASGLVNAVLRKAVVFELEKAEFINEIERISVIYSVSQSVAELFVKRIPNYEQVLKQSFTKPVLSLRINTLVSSIDEVENYFTQKDIKIKRGFAENCLYVDFKGNITKTQLFKTGAFHVQGEASQLVCAVLAPLKGQKVVDVCAAPGGKSATLAQYMQNSGTLLSCDAAENRLSLINSALERMKITCAQVMHNDATIYNKALADADVVLCDVPCSGLGILGKKPDLRMKNMADIESLTKIQLNILKTCSKYVKIGGKLMYSTCTINPDENKKIVDKFLINNTEFEICEIKNLPSNAQIDNKCATLYPTDYMSDGFFMALFTRKV